jgi:hypothetical protein
MFLEQMTRYSERWKPVDVDAIGLLLVAYRPRHQPRPNRLHQEMQKSKPDASKLFPEAPNREAVEHNLRASIRTFEEALPGFAQFEAGHRLLRWQDLLRLNLQHTTSAERHFTNGQSIVTRLKLEDGRFSVALHENLEGFLSELQSWPSLRAHRLATVETEQESRALAIEWLSHVTETTIPVRIDGNPGTMSWRTWGWIAGSAGYRRQGLVLTVADRSVWTELDGQPGAKFEAYAVLNQLPTLLPGVEAETCATCFSFAFSGMSRDMSGGWTGYCRHPDAQEAPAPHRSSPSVSVAYRCERYRKVLDRDRQHPYIRAQ